MSRAQPVYLVDASVYVFRAWFSIPDSMCDPDGRPVNALYGFGRFLGDLLARTEPLELGVAFDESLSTSYRNEIFPAYKANRDKTPEELIYQFGLCRELTAALGLAGFAHPRFEADDIIGTLADDARQRARKSVIVTRDKDLAQLLQPGDVMWDFAGNVRTGHADVPQKYGVRAEQMADFLALTGDAVDNIPGVPGIGPKTASALLAEFDDLDAVYAGLDSVSSLAIRGAASVARKLAEHRDAAYLAQRLTRIDCAVPLPGTQTRLVRQRPDLEALGELFDRVGFGAAQRRQAERLADAWDQQNAQQAGRLFP